MNDLGKAYIKKISKSLSTLHSKKENKVKFKEPSLEIIYERIMRMSREVRFYELDEYNPNEMYNFALTTLKEDFVNFFIDKS